MLLTGSTDFSVHIYLDDHSAESKNHDTTIVCNRILVRYSIETYLRTSVLMGYFCYYKNSVVENVLTV